MDLVHSLCTTYQQPTEEFVPMLAKLYSCAILGLDGGLIEVEVDISQGLPAFTIVGLPDAAVQESRERIRPAEVSRLSQCQYTSRFVLSAR